VFKVAEITREIPLVTMEGTPRDRGRAYGELRKAGILSLIEHWKMFLGDSNDIDPEKYLGEFLEQTSLLNAVKRWTPDLLEEVEGIGEGAGVDFKTIFALQLVDEEWWFHIEKKGVESSENGFDAARCSAVGILGEAGMPNYVAQNMDLPGYYDGHQVLLHIIDSDMNLETMVFSVDGMIALAGLNNHGIGICCNALEQLNHSKDGLPVAFVHRGVLCRSKFNDAIDFVHQIKHSSGQNYIIGDSKRILGLECSANKVVRQSPHRRNPLLCHTNHPLISDDVMGSPNPVASNREPGQEREYSDSEIRLKTLVDKLTACSKPVNVEEINSVLSSHEPPDHPICRHVSLHADTMTLGCMIMELSLSPAMYLSSSPPCSNILSTYRF
jgi:hypothetical protein